MKKYGQMTLPGAKFARFKYPLIFIRLLNIKKLIKVAETIWQEREETVKFFFKVD